MLTVFEKKGKIPAYDFQQAKQGPRPPVLCWQRFRPVISAREIPTPTLTHQRSGATSAGGSVRHTLRHTRPSRFRFTDFALTARSATRKIAWNSRPRPL